MATTENEIYYQDDYSTPADVPSDMKKMAESIDKKVGELTEDIDGLSNSVEALGKQNTNIAKDVSTNTTDISNIKQEQVTQNENISELQEKNEKLEAKNIELEEENKLLKKDLANTTIKGQANGENITIKDSAEVRFPMLKIKGNSKKETRSGKNKLKNIATSTVYGGITYTKNNDESVTVNGTSEGSYINIGKIIAKEGETYILTGCPSGGSSNGYMLTTNIDAGNRDYDIGEGVSFSYPEGTEIAINLRVANGTTVSNLTFYPMVRLSTETDTTYEKYGETPSTEIPSETKNVTGNTNIIVCNENFFSGSLSNGIKNNNGEITQTSVNTYRHLDITLPAGTYKFKQFSSTDFNRVKSANITENANLTNPFTLEKPSTVSFTFRKADSSDWDVGEDASVIPFMLSKSDVDNSTLIKGKSQSFTFPLAEGQRLYKRSYLADDGIHHKRGRAVFDGTETWTKDTNYSPIDYYYYANSNNTNLNMDINNIKTAICSHFKYIEYSYAKEGFWATAVFGISIKNETIGVIDEDDKGQRITKFKNYLAEQYANETPVTVEYELEEEVIEPYTEEQLKVYKEINKTVHSYKGITHIFSTDEISPEFDVIYSKDLEILFNQVNSALVEGGM